MYYIIPISALKAALQNSSLEEAKKTAEDRAKSNLSTYAIVEIVVESKAEVTVKTTDTKKAPESPLKPIDYNPVSGGSIYGPSRFGIYGNYGY